MTYELDAYDLAVVARITNVLPEDRAECAVIERDWLAEAQRRLDDARRELRAAEREVRIREVCIARLEDQR